MGDERAILVHSWFEAGYNNERIQSEAEKIDPTWHLGLGSIARHRKNHIRVRQEAPTGQNAVPDDISDLEALRLIIQRGAKFIPNWKIGPREFFDALKMYYQMTQGSAMTDFFAAITAAASEEDEDVVIMPDDPGLEALDAPETNSD